MLYKKYHLYENMLDIMIPSDFDYNQDERTYSRNSWKSKDKTISIDVNLYRFNKDEVPDLLMRMQEHYYIFENVNEHFSCSNIKKRTNYDKAFGEIHYTTKVFGYSFINIQLNGVLKEKELLVNIQCLEKDWENNKHLFEVVMDSIKIFGKEEIYENRS